MIKNERIHKIKTIVLLIILIAIGGLVLYGGKDKPTIKKTPPSFKNLMQTQK